MFIRDEIGIYFQRDDSQFMGLPTGGLDIYGVERDLRWDFVNVGQAGDGEDGGLYGEFLFLFTLVIKLTIDSQDFPLHVSMIHNLYQCVMVTCAQVIALGSTISHYGTMINSLFVLHAKNSINH